MHSPHGIGRIGAPVFLKCFHCQDSVWFSEFVPKRPMPVLCICVVSVRVCVQRSKQLESAFLRWKFVWPVGFAGKCYIKQYAIFFGYSKASWISELWSVQGYLSPLYLLNSFVPLLVLVKTNGFTTIGDLEVRRLTEYTNPPIPKNSARRVSLLADFDPQK